MAYKDKADLYKNQIARWVKIKMRAVEYLGGSCKHCGGRFPYPAMQFHHRDPAEKDASWVKIRLRAWASITAELDKCDLLCANCHAIFHSPEWPAWRESNPQPTP